MDRARLETYQDLKGHAERVGQWPKWRTRAIDHLRERFKEAMRKHANDRWLRPDQSTLVEILLWEKDTEAAWSAAQTGGCHPEYWMKLVALREKDHPLDALQVYRAEIKRLLDNTGSSPDYSGVVRLVRRMRELMSRIGREREFAAYLDEIRTVYKRKRNLMKLLDRVKTAPAA